MASSTVKGARREVESLGTSSRHSQAQAGVSRERLADTFDLVQKYASMLLYR